MKIPYVRFNEFGKKSALIAVFFCLVFITAFWSFYHIPKQQEILKMELEYKKMLKIEDNILIYKSKYGDLDEYMQKVEERYELASKSLPDRMQQGEFIRLLQQIAVETQVNITALSPDSVKNVIKATEDDIKDKDTKLMENVTKLPISVKIECGYVQLINFLKAIEDSERLTQIKNLSIVSKDNGERLICELNIIIFALEKQD